MKLKGINYQKEDVLQAINDLDSHKYLETDYKTVGSKEYDFIYNNKKYPPKRVFECLAKNKGYEIGKDFQPSILIPQLRKLGFNVVKKSISNTQNVEILRDELLNYCKSKGLTIDNSPQKYTAVKLKNNIAEIHNIGKNTNKFRVVISYDKLPSDLKNNCHKVPNSYNWTLNGECWIDTMDMLKDIQTKLDYIIRKENLPIDNIKKDNNVMKQSLNQILYGPPGTGKTYNTVIESMKIIGLKSLFSKWFLKTSEAKSKEKVLNYYLSYSNKILEQYKIDIFQIFSIENFEQQKRIILSGDYYINNLAHSKTSIGASYTDSLLNWYEKFLKELDYGTIKKEYDELKKSGQIEFVTFHQSYSYEEFVEGIKPDLQNENDLKYKLENGIFKQICNNATKNITDNFDEVYNVFINKISQVEEDDFYKLYTLKNHKVFGLQVNNNNNLNIYMTDNFNKQGVITKENLKKHFEKLRETKDWIYYYDSIIDHLKNNYNLTSKETELKPHVLIIDEINRGNISKIFGELITLIEEDKRENFSVTLPYSKESFTIPKNLYIIGTMNTSDRSIASVDIALRRRFKFKEMMPKVDLVSDFDCNFSQCFELLNKKISILLDRDHQIGHSYFIKEKHENDGIKELKDIWFDSILPLLNEYFYGDWEKLQAILGKAANNQGKNINSFIKILDDIFDSDICGDEENYDFVEFENCNFEVAMKKAFGNIFGAKNE